MSVDRPSTALRTDRYELTMVDAALRSGVAATEATFEVFARRLPPGRRFGVFAGLDRVLDGIEDFRFGPEELAWLAREEIVSAPTLDWLADYRFSGHVDAYAEGECYTAGSPVLTVEGTFAEAVLLETMILSILNHDSAVAAAAAQIAAAAGDRPLIEMGSRRTDIGSATAAARAAYLAGFTTTSNLEAGRRYGIPTAGTAAHAFVLAHDSERAAFAAQIDAMGVGTTLLVDTFDVDAGIRTAVDVAGPGLGGVRIDSGDLPDEARRARRILDGMGATGTRIIVTGDLDDAMLDTLTDVPVDGYGVGTNVVTGLGHPTAGFVYKLVAVGALQDPDAQHPVAKLSPGKQSIGGRKRAWRARLASAPEGTEGPRGPGRDDPAAAHPAPGEPVWVDVVVADTSPVDTFPVATFPVDAAAGPAGEAPSVAALEGLVVTELRPLQRRVVQSGAVTARVPLAEARAWHLARRAEIPRSDALFLVRG